MAEADRKGIQARADEGPRPFEPIQEAAAGGRYEEGDTTPAPLAADFATVWYHNEPGDLARGNGLRAYRPKVVTIYQRKGGVGKTTTAYQLGHAFAASGTRTMMVDLDSQQDLTELCFRNVAQYGAPKEYFDVQEYLREELPKGAANGAGKRTCESLASAVRFPLKLPGGGKIRNKPPWATDCALMKPYPFQVKSVVDDHGTVADVDNLFLVQGGVNFEEMEHALAKKYAGFGTSSVADHINGPGSLFHAIWNAGYDIEAEVILLDLSPALGVTNELMLMHSDFFMLPCHTDRLSEKNTLKLRQTFEEWYKKLQEGGRRGGSSNGGDPRQGFRDASRGLTTDHIPDNSAELPLPDIEPQFLGLVMVKYEKSVKSKKRDRDGRTVSERETFKGDARKAYAGRLVRAAREFSRHLTRPDDRGRRGVMCALPQNEFEKATGSGKGAFRHNFGSEFLPQYLTLARVCAAGQGFSTAIELFGKPIGQLTEEDLKKKAGGEFLFGNWASDKDRHETVAHYRRVFSDLAKFINYLDQPKPYNFVFDPRCTDRESTVVEGYPTADTVEAVNGMRTAGVWTDAGGGGGGGGSSSNSGGGAAP